MIKSKILTSLALVTLVSSFAFAGEPACCAGGSANASKEKCTATFAKLDLNAEQRSQMESLAADCEKSGCTKESFAKMEKGAKQILSKEQLAMWKSACAKAGEKS